MTLPKTKTGLRNRLVKFYLVSTSLTFACMEGAAALTWYGIRNLGGTEANPAAWPYVHSFWAMTGFILERWGLWFATIGVVIGALTLAGVTWHGWKYWAVKIPLAFLAFYAAFDFGHDLIVVLGVVL